MSNQKKEVYLAIDLGAGSGRVLSGTFDGTHLTLGELSRFDNTPIFLPDGWHWNLPQLFQSALGGIRAAKAEFGDAPRSIGVDTWGVDYGLFDKAGRLLGLPYCYRDSRTDGMIEEADKRIGSDFIYKGTGIQFMFFNTLNQLLSDVIKQNPALDVAEQLLFMPDILNYWLSGVQVQERTIASTSQLYNPATADWHRELIGKVGAPDRLFKNITDPGTILGNLRPELSEQTGLNNLQVISVGGHDTASAVAALPTLEKTPCFLSSGTWSLMGIEIEKPVITEETLRDGFTNEVGFGNKVRFLKNICGLWLIQESRSAWNAQGENFSYSRLELLAREVSAFRSLIDPDDARFAKAGNMPEKIQSFCKDTGQPVPHTPGEITRCIYESLALKYRSVWDKLCKHTQTPPQSLNIVGGGSRDSLLNQFTANALGKPVNAGPAEATSLGNILAQMIATGEISSLEEGRAIISKSNPVDTYEPQDANAWEDAYGRFQTILNS